MNYEEIKVKANEKYEEAKQKTKETVDWVVENPDKALGVLAIISTVTGATIKVGKKISKSIQQREAERHMYCGTVNRSVRLKHPLSNKEIKQLASLMQSGLTRYEALNVMGVIK